ncbi:MAG: M15 family metallopeptidase [Elainellaceae cyanobacterium]
MSPSEQPSKQPKLVIHDDIPVAQRDENPRPNSSRRFSSPGGLFNKEFWILGGAAMAIAILAGGFVAWGTAPVEPPSAAVPAVVTPEISLEIPEEPTEPLPVPDDGVPDDTLLGHLPYEEAPADSLAPIVADGSILMRQAAAAQFMAMADAAAAEGILLEPTSGFRSIEDQEYLFFEVKAERGQIATTRAEVSAPPGYSEHHTGYAVDILDGSRSDIGLVEAFETTDAFRWLQENAAFYSFELSFPRDNPQGISYEPWHWRFVGDRNSLETFYRATNLTTSETSPEASPETSPETSSPPPATP